jgi:hypothetical protein
MNNSIKRLLLGLLIWGIPFIVSFGLWDPINGGPSIQGHWFNAIMLFSLSTGYAIAAYYFFKGKIKKPVIEGWKTGFIWYGQALVMDLIVLVGLFGMELLEYTQFFVAYLNIVVLSVAIGYIKRK